jgi:hypothetical protein
MRIAMSASDLTIDQLMPNFSRIQETREEAKRVVRYSCTQTPSVSDVLNIVPMVFTIRISLGKLVRSQSTLLQRFMAADFTRGSQSDIGELAELIEHGVATGRDLLAETNKLGSEIRIWWRKPMREFAQQIEHLDSIAESLRLECEPGVTMLLVSAASRVVPDRRSSQR